MASGGGSRPPPPSLALTSHRITSHRIARHHMLRSCSAAPRRAADHALTRGTRRAQQLQRIMLVLMLPARATRQPTSQHTLHSAEPARPSQPARTITGPGTNGLQLLGEREDADRREGRRGCSEAWQLRSCPPTCRSKLTQQDQDEHDGRAVELLHLEEAAAPQLLFRPRMSNGSSEAKPRQKKFIEYRSTSVRGSPTHATWQVRLSRLHAPQ